MWLCAYRLCSAVNDEESDDEDGDDSGASGSSLFSKNLLVEIPTLPLRVLLASVQAGPSSDGVGDTSDSKSMASEDSVVVEAGGDVPMLGSESDGQPTIARRNSLTARSFPFSTPNEAFVLGKTPTPSQSYAPVFTDAEAALIESELPSCTVSGLTAKENLLLMGVAAVTHTLYGTSVAASMDPAGSKFILAVKLFDMAKKCLPQQYRPRSLSYGAMMWALQSDSQDSLLPLAVPADVSVIAACVTVGLALQS